MTFRKEFEELVAKYSKAGTANDAILSTYLNESLMSFDKATRFDKAYIANFNPNLKEKCRDGFCDTLKH